MVLKTIQELNEYIEATGVVYNHSNTKLISRKSKVKRSRREAFLSLLPYRRLSSHHHHAENKPFTKQKSKSKPIVESATSKTRQKLQVSVRSQLPHGSKTLNFEVDPDTSVSSLKELIHRRIGVLPQRQHLHIGNIPLLDFLTLHENGVDKKDIISLSTDDLTPDGPKVTCQSRDEAERTQAQKPDETRSEKEQSGATPQEEEKMGKTKAHDKEETPIIWCIKGYLQVFVKNPLLRGPRMLCFQLEPETSISSLKEKIHERIGVKPKLQHLHIRRNTRNFQLHDLLTLNDCGVQQDETIVLRLPTGGLLGGGRTDPNDVAKQDTNKKQTDGNRVNLPSDSQETPRQDSSLKMMSSSQHKRMDQEQDSQQGTSSNRARLGEGEIDNPNWPGLQEEPTEGLRKRSHLLTSAASVEYKGQTGARDQAHQHRPVEEKKLVLVPGKLDDSSLYSLSEQISARTWTKLAIKLGFCHAEVTHFEAEHPSDVVRRFFDMLVKWRNRQPGDINQTEALCKALKEVGETRLADDLAGGASLQSGQPSGDMSENQPSTSQQPAAQGAVSHSQTPDFQRLPQTEQHVSGSGNTPINNPTDCTINIYPSKGGAHTSLQPGQALVDMSENQPSTSQQPTTPGAVSYSLFTLNLTLNIQTFVVRNGTIDRFLTDLLEGLTCVYDKARHLFKTFGELLYVKSGSVVFVVRISSRASLEKLWTMYTSGELAKKLTEIFITDELTTEDKTDLSIQVTIQESYYDRACRFFEELQRASYEDLTHQLSGDMLENQPSTPQQPTTQGAVSHPLTPDLKCSTSDDVQSQDFYKKEEMRDPNDVAKQDTNKKQTDGNRVNPPSDSQETPRQGEQQSTRSETQDFSVKSSSQHKRTAQEQDSQQGTLSSRARQGEAGKLDDSNLYSLSKQIPAKKWTELAIKLGFCHAEGLHFEANYPHDVVRRFFDMLVEWRNRQPGDINQIEALCKVLKEVGETRLADDLAECSTSDVQSQVATKCKDALKKHYECTGAYVPLNPWLGKHKKHFVEIYTRLQLAKARDRKKLMQGLESLTESKSKDRLVSYEDILLLKTETGKLIQIAVLSGLAGRGKTTLLDKIALDWATGCSQVLQKYELVFLLKMCYLEQVSSLIDAVFGQFLFAEDAFKDTEKDALMSYIQENADKVLFLLDGFDELKTISLSNPILKILNRKSCRGCTVLVSTRPSHFDRLVSKELVQEPFTHVRVLGFNTEDMRDYVKRYYSDELYKAEGLLEKIQSSNNFSTLAESPMLLLLMCLLWREDSTLPETMSQLYQRAIKYIGKRKDISKEEMSRVVIALGQVSLHGLLSPDQELTFQESGFEQSVLNTALKVGIVNRQRVCKSLEPQCIVQFIHKTFQEFSAAVYLQSISKADTKTFHDAVNEIMSKDPFAFEYLLRFCCGDNEACTLEILKVFQERHQKDLSFGSWLGQLALHCYFEGQCKRLPPEEFIRSFLPDRIFIDCDFNNDTRNLVRYFVQRIAEQAKKGGHSGLPEVEVRVSLNDVSYIVEIFSRLPNLGTLNLSGNILSGRAASWWKQVGQCKVLNLNKCSLKGQDIAHVAESLSGLPNLVGLHLSRNYLGGTAASWCKQLGQCKALQDLDLSNCEMNGQDMAHVTNALNGLPNLVRLDLSNNNIPSDQAAFRDPFFFATVCLTEDDPAALWCTQLGKCKALQHLYLICCRLKGQDMVHVAESLTGLPNLVRLSLSSNNLGGTAASWCKQLGQCKALQDLDLSDCSLNGQDMVHVAESLKDLPHLVKLNLSGSNLRGAEASFCDQVKMFKALKDLNLSRCPVRSEDIRVIEQLKNDPETSVKVTFN